MRATKATMTSDKVNDKVNDKVSDEGGGKVACCRMAVTGIAMLFLAVASSALASEPISWWKGNLHTHTLWSDGDDYPEMVVEWYKTNGYHFVVLSDHNITQQGEKWVGLGTNKTAAIALQKYLERFPNAINRIRSTNGTEMIRLKTLSEFRGT